MHIFKKGIKTRLIILFISFAIIPPLLQGIIVNRIYTNQLEEKLNEVSRLGLEKLSSDLEIYFQKVYDLSTSYSNDYQVKTELNMTILDPSRLERTRNVMADSIRAAQGNIDIPINVSIVDRTGKVYSDRQVTEVREKEISNTLFHEAWYVDSFKSQSVCQWLGIMKNHNPFGASQVFSLARHMVLDGEYLGTLVIGIDDYLLYRLIDKVKISKNSEIYIMDRAKILLRSGEFKKSGNQVLNVDILSFINQANSLYSDYRIFEISGEKYMVSYYRMPNFGWNLTSITPVSAISNELKYLKIFPLFLLMIVLVFSVILVIILNKEITKPIVQLSMLMKEVRKGNLDVSSDLQYENEIGELGNGFNKMVADLKIYIRRIHEEEEKKRLLEFRVLESQIKPHFLYNTLNSIKWMAEMQNAESVSNAIVSLVKLIEFNMGSPEVLVRVSGEIEALQHYISLQQLRYWNSFEAFYSISKETEDLYIPKLSLQPIVENSIKHGLSNMSEKGELKLSSRIEDDCLIFEITDNGIGMEKQQTENLLNDEQEQGENIVGGIGLKNVYQRIRLRYGDRYGVSIKSEKGKGTSIYLVFPIIKNTLDGGSLYENHGSR